MHLQDYERFLIVDLEATCCDQGTIDKHDMEIIEIGAVMVSAEGFTVLSEYQTFIKPIKNPRLTPFCQQLTTITQSEKDKAPGFADAIANFNGWLSQYDGFAFCSWGNYDKNQLNNDCTLHDVPNPIRAPHVNIKKVFSTKQGLKKQFGMARALKHVGIEQTGTHHRGIDDARNMVRLMPYIV
tara:strand:- start:117 stop:665 length:549 start_codon:yes stop_codon:yes gene_type:complete